ncbi:MAG: class I SAM-dependent methyltransferase [Magnetospirillum sp. WYHS-4]
MTKPADGPDFYEGGDLEALSTLHRYRRWIVDSFRPELKGATVEIGAGIGNFADELLPHASRLDLIEPTPRLCKAMEDRFAGNERVAIHAEFLEAWIAGAPAGHYDSVVLVNVLEHIEDDAAALAEIYRILKPGGHLFLLVPALQLLYSRLDALVGHHRRYHLPELAARVDQAGLAVVRARYFDVMGVLPWLILNRILGFTEFKPGMASLYDRIFVPITRRLETLVAPPFGKNVVLVARKPG